MYTIEIYSTNETSAPLSLSPSSSSPFCKLLPQGRILGFTGNLDNDRNYMHDCQRSIDRRCGRFFVSICGTADTQAIHLFSVRVEGCVFQNSSQKLPFYVQKSSEPDGRICVLHTLSHGERGRTLAFSPSSFSDRTLFSRQMASEDGSRPREREREQKGRHVCDAPV